MAAADDSKRIDLRAFFDEYARASRSEEAKALAALYAATFIVGGPRGSASFANDARFIDWLRDAFQTNRQRGLRTLEVVSIDPIVLSTAHTLAIVTWGMRFERTGERLIEIQISYLLEHVTGEPKILSYISQADEEAALSALGLD